MKFGRRPAVHTRRTMRSALALFSALDPLGAAPSVSADYVSAVDAHTGGDWGVYLNDSLGDCVCADTCHQLMLYTANVGTMLKPADSDCLNLYEAVGGYTPSDPSTDQGCDETAMCQYMQSTGLCGQRSAGSAMVDPPNLAHIRWAVQIFGACRLGITVGDESIDQFDKKQPWEALAASNPGGHDVPAVKYDADYLYVVTWGGLQPVAWSLVANPQFLQEAHAEAYPDFVLAGGTTPSGFDLDSLVAKLKAIAA